VEGDPADGAEVEVVSHAGHFIARGFYNSQSKIRVRLYEWTPSTPLDEAFFRKRIQNAVHLRHAILKLDQPRAAYRVIFSEADGLSGLTVDRYDRWLTVQFTSLAMARREAMIASLLEEIFQPAGIYRRTERGIGGMEGLELADGLIQGDVPDKPVSIDDHGLAVLVHLTAGQKTGYFLDQRENRVSVAAYCRGRRVLDAFCYTGGFGLLAARNGAAEVVGIDSSQQAMDLARANAQANQLEQVSFVKADVFEELDRRADHGEKFGVVILDPPKFARTNRAIDEALRGYRRLQTLALRLLEPDGILATCCCSGLIPVDMLHQLLAQLSVCEGRPIQLLATRGAAPDHPVAATCPESNYLKCLITRVT
jgi:23S rRNA (cytosine1962-C5)-methyltransferase